MMLSRATLQILANRERVALGILEKDYVITEVLKALSQVPILNQALVFKGGTALRKVYFPNWRYSEDLDFTVRHDIRKDDLKQVLETWYRQVEQASQIQLATKMLHKPNGYARVRTRFVGPLAYPSTIYMDLDFDEPLCLEAEHRRILTYPFPDEERNILVYPLEELLAEKMRSILQRGKSRDYYDVWRILKEKASELNLDLVGQVLDRKLINKGLRVSTVSEFLPNDLSELNRYWEEALQPQLGAPLRLQEVLEELKCLLARFVAPYILISK